MKGSRKVDLTVVYICPLDLLIYYIICSHTQLSLDFPNSPFPCKSALQENQSPSASPKTIPSHLVSSHPTLEFLGPCLFVHLRLHLPLQHVLDSHPTSFFSNTTRLSFLRPHGLPVRSCPFLLIPVLLKTLSLPEVRLSWLRNMEGYQRGTFSSSLRKTEQRTSKEGAVGADPSRFFDLHFARSESSLLCLGLDGCMEL